MKIIAFAIYDLDIDDGSPFQSKRIKIAQKSSLGLFSHSPISHFEEKILPLMLKNFREEGVNTYQDEHEFFYLQKNQLNQGMYFIISERRLERDEVGYLFHNMGHVHMRGDKINTSLQNMLDNPLNYIGRDILVRKIGDNLEELKDQVHVAFDKLVERGDNLKELEEKTIRLSVETESFAMRAKEMNKCCSWF